VLNSSNQPIPFGGSVFVERDGQYQLEPLENLSNGDYTYWGVFEDITLKGKEFYYSFARTLYNRQLDNYERKLTKIAVNSLVHPRAVIHAEVTIEPGAVVQEGAELLEGAIVKAGRGVAAHQKFHHLMANIDLVKQPMSTAAVSPTTEASKPNPTLPDADNQNTHPARQYLESH